MHVEQTTKTRPESKVASYNTQHNNIGLLLPMIAQLHSKERKWEKNTVSKVLKILYVAYFIKLN